MDTGKDSEQGHAFADKAALRTHLRSIRESMPAGKRASWSNQLCNHALAFSAVAMAETVFCYVARDDEPDTRDLIETLIGNGKKLWVPRTSGGRIQALPFTDWESLRPSKLGILEPDGALPARDAFDVTLAPGLGYTSGGDRVGHGAGYYDRWFREHAGGLRIGLVFEAQLVEAIPVDENDVPVDAVVTEERVIDVAAGKPRQL